MFSVELLTLPDHVRIGHRRLEHRGLGKLRYQRTHQDPGIRPALRSKNHVIQVLEVQRLRLWGEEAAAVEAEVAAVESIGWPGDLSPVATV